MSSVLRSAEGGRGTAGAPASAARGMPLVTAALAAVLLLCALPAAQWLRPTQRTADIKGAIDLALQVPVRFGEWREDTSQVPLLPDPGLQATRDSTYSQVLARTYVNNRQQRVMLSIAYGNDQISEATAVHRPEFCYRSQGFNVQDAGLASVPLAGHTLRVQRLVAKLDGRFEPISYWITLDETATLPGENVDELVDRARQEVESVRELIDEVLFLSELESGGRVVSLGPVAVRPELERATAELEERASRAGVALVVSGDPAIELEIRPRMLRVVAQNLAENAVRYAGPGTTFTLAIEREGDAVVLRGTDDGVGVNEEELSRLFERFYRADHTRASRGTGLGLAIVKHIVGQAGGTVEAGGGKGAGLEIRCVFAPPQP